jgi:LPXTG-motif cell wall-anchored protein
MTGEFMQTSKFRIETLTGPPIPIPDAQVYVRSRLVQLRFPADHGGLIWNRPVALVVRTLDGQEKTVPIVDVTRMAVFTLAGICFTSLLAFLFLRRKKAKA